MTRYTAALALILALNLPTLAFALRASNAGQEESVARQALERELAPLPATGLEEERSVEIVFQWVHSNVLDGRGHELTEVEARQFVESYLSRLPSRERLATLRSEAQRTDARRRWIGASTPEPPPEVVRALDRLPASRYLSAEDFGAIPAVIVGPSVWLHVPSIPGRFRGHAVEKARAESALRRVQERIVEAQQQTDAPRIVRRLDIERALLADVIAPMLEGRLRREDNQRTAEEMVAAIGQALRDRIQNASAHETVNPAWHHAAALARDLLVELQHHETPRQGASIVFADDLTLAEALRLARHHVVGAFVVRQKKNLSHLRIVSASLGIPVVSGLRESIPSRFPPGVPVLVDTNRRRVIVAPADDEIYSARFALEYPSEVKVVEARKAGVNPRWAAAVNLPEEILLAARHGVHDVALFRTEMWFLDEGRIPTEAEQVEVYHWMAGVISGTLTVRLADFSGEKQAAAEEILATPIAGHLLEFYLRDPRGTELLDRLLRPVLVAATDAPRIRLLIPMVRSAEDLRRIRARLTALAEQLKASGRPTPEHLPTVGAMIETREVMGHLSDVLQEADFLAIGTSDLITALLGIRREQEIVSWAMVPQANTVFDAIWTVSEAAQSAGKDVALLGYLAEHPQIIAQFGQAPMRSLHFSAWGVAPVLIPYLQPADAGLEEPGVAASALDDRLRVAVQAVLRSYPDDVRPYYEDLDRPDVRFAVHLGAHVSGSSSPPAITHLYNHVARLPGIQLVSIPLDTSPEALEDTLQGILKHPRVVLVTSTQPHKPAVARFLQERAGGVQDPRVRPIPSTNNAWLHRAPNGTVERALLMNSDGPGFVLQFKQVWGRYGDRDGSLAGKRIVLLGGWGGLGQAVAIAVAKESPASIVVSERPEVVGTARRELGALVPLTGLAPEAVAVHAADAPALLEALRHADIIVNASGIGMNDERSPVADPTVFQRGAGQSLVVIDSIYRAGDGRPRPVTPFLQQTWDHGVRAVFNGVGLYVRDFAWEAAWVSEQVTGQTLSDRDQEQIYHTMSAWAHQARGLREARDALEGGGLEEGTDRFIREMTRYGKQLAKLGPRDPATAFPNTPQNRLILKAYQAQLGFLHAMGLMRLVWYPAMRADILPAEVAERVVAIGAPDWSVTDRENIYAAWGSVRGVDVEGALRRIALSQSGATLSASSIPPSPLQRDPSTPVTVLLRDFEGSKSGAQRFLEHVHLWLMPGDTVVLFGAHPRFEQMLRGLTYLEVRNEPLDALHQAQAAVPQLAEPFKIFRLQKIRRGVPVRTAARITAVIQEAAADEWFGLSLAPGAIQSRRQRMTPLGRTLYNAYNAAQSGTIPTLADWPSALRAAGREPGEIYQNHTPQLSDSVGSREAALDARLAPLFALIQPSVIRAISGPVVVFIEPRLLDISQVTQQTLAKISRQLRERFGCDITVTANLLTATPRALGGTSMLQIVRTKSEMLEGSWALVLAGVGRAPKLSAAALVPLVVRGLSQVPRSVEVVDAKPYFKLEVTLPDMFDALKRYL